MLFFFFFNDTATTEIYTLSLHDALPICHRPGAVTAIEPGLAYLTARERIGVAVVELPDALPVETPLLNLKIDRKSTRLNSSHGYISYAVFCLKKKNDVTACSGALARPPA